MICAWAEEGADALEPDGTLVHVDAFPPERLVDTLGAGDTFNAAVIFALSGGGHGLGGSARLGLAPPLGASRLPRVRRFPPRAEPAGRSYLRLPHRGEEVRDPRLRRHRLSRAVPPAPRPIKLADPRHRLLPEPPCAPLLCSHCGQQRLYSSAPRYSANPRVLTPPTPCNRARCGGGSAWEGPQLR